MKIVIDIPKTVYEAYKEWHKNKVATVEQSIIANGTPYEEKGKCKTCNYYHPYCEQFTNEPRGDGYCVIARMTPEGLTTINCTDEFGCSDYQEKQGAKNVF